MRINYIYIIVHTPNTLTWLSSHQERERYLKLFPHNRPDKEGIPLEEFKKEICGFLEQRGWIERNDYLLWTDSKHRQFILYIDMITRKDEWMDFTTDDKPQGIQVPASPVFDQWVKLVLSFPKDETKYVFI